MNEYWKDIPGYENIYQASSFGRIRTKEGKTTFTKRHGIRHWNQRVLKQKSDKQGYKRVELWKNGEHKTRTVHQLVALTFLDNPSRKPLINHKDCNPSNNSIDNIEWATYRENLIHAYENKLNQEPITTILINKKTGKKNRFISMAEASRFLNKNNGYISCVLKRGKTEIENYFIVSND